MPPVRSDLPGSPDERAGSLRRGVPGTVRSLGSYAPIARGAERGSDSMIRVYRTAPVIHHTMRAARAKPQVSDPDEFSAPTEPVAQTPRSAYPCPSGGQACTGPRVLLAASARLASFQMVNVAASVRRVLVATHTTSLLGEDGA